jgi:tRNA-Thr(GGU) m(6)t(6)A37 methyltransferase TsaA
MKDNGTYQVYAIGQVRREEDQVYLEIAAPYRPALKQLEHFSHVLVFWWADQYDNEESRSQLQCHPPYAAEHLTGVFATRAEYRPNPIALTICPILAVDETHGILQVANIDAFDSTPVLDLKAYFPVLDRVRDVRLPVWLAGWPKWMPEDGIGFYDED